MTLKKKLLHIFHKVTARFRKNPIYSYLLKTTGNNLEEKKWIFILGCYNSGTTLLNKILADHPSIAGLPDEGVMLTDKLVKPEDFGWRRMWAQCEQEIQDKKCRDREASTIKKQWSHFYGNKEFLVEKSISNVCRIPFFRKNFQPAYFIHIVRNGYAVSEGIRRKAVIMENNPLYGRKNYPIDLCAKQWTRHLEVIEAQKPDISHFTEISYEDFTENPQNTMKKLTNFLGIPEYSSDYFHNSFSVHEKDSKIKNMNERSLKSLNSKEFQEVNEVAGDYLVKYGYELMS